VVLIILLAEVLVVRVINHLHLLVVMEDLVVGDMVVEVIQDKIEKEQTELKTLVVVVEVDHIIMVVILMVEVLVVPVSSSLLILHK
jgi:hypothetical protein